MPTTTHKASSLGWRSGTPCPLLFALALALAAISSFAFSFSLTFALPVILPTHGVDVVDVVLISNGLALPGLLGLLLRTDGDPGLATGRVSIELSRTGELLTFPEKLLKGKLLRFPKLVCFPKLPD